MPKLFDGEEKFSAKLKSLRTSKALSRECFTSSDENEIEFLFEMLILMISISRARQKSSRRGQNAHKNDPFSFSISVIGIESSISVEWLREISS